MHGKRHRDGDLPAIESGVDSEYWKHGVRSRGQDLPATVTDAGRRIMTWFQDGAIGRPDDKPAIVIEYPDSQDAQTVQIWFKDGFVGRTGGNTRPFMIQSDESQWFSPLMTRQSLSRGLANGSAACCPTARSSGLPPTSPSRARS